MSYYATIKRVKDIYYLGRLYDTDKHDFKTVEYINSINEENEVGLVFMSSQNVKDFIDGYKEDITKIYITENLWNVLDDDTLGKLEKSLINDNDYNLNFSQDKENHCISFGFQEIEHLFTFGRINMLPDSKVYKFLKDLGLKITSTNNILMTTKNLIKFIDCHIKDIENFESDVKQVFIDNLIQFNNALKKSENMFYYLDIKEC